MESLLYFHYLKILCHAITRKLLCFAITENDLRLIGKYFAITRIMLCGLYWRDAEEWSGGKLFDWRCPAAHLPHTTFGLSAGIVNQASGILKLKITDFNLPGSYTSAEEGAHVWWSSRSAAKGQFWEWEASRDGAVVHEWGKVTIKYDQ